MIKNFLLSVAVLLVFVDSSCMNEVGHIFPKSFKDSLKDYDSRFFSSINEKRERFSRENDSNTFGDYINSFNSMYENLVKELDDKRNEKLRGCVMKKVRALWSDLLAAYQSSHVQYSGNLLSILSKKLGLELTTEQ